MQLHWGIPVSGIFINSDFLGNMLICWCGCYYQFKRHNCASCYLDTGFHPGYEFRWKTDYHIEFLPSANWRQKSSPQKPIRTMAKIYKKVETSFVNKKTNPFTLYFLFFFLNSWPFQSEHFEFQSPKSDTTGEQCRQNWMSARISG